MGAVKTEQALSVPVFPYPQARQYLIDAVARWLPKDLSGYAEKVVDLHLDPRNFPMSIAINKPALVKALQEEKSLEELREFITFEDTRTASGIARVMVRTHLNRSGINYVSRGFKNKTLANRVLGVFPPGLDPRILTSWSALISRWISFAADSHRRGITDDEGQPLFSPEDMNSLQALRGVSPEEYKNAKDHTGVHNNWGRLMAGIHSGLVYFQNEYGFDPRKIGEVIEAASVSDKTVNKLVSNTSHGIDEYGKTLAGSFYADLGAASFVKDDVHVVDSIAAFTGRSTSQVKGSFAFDVLHHSAKVHGVTARAIDKVMYLTCSTDLNLFGFRLPKNRANAEKVRFLEFLNGFSPVSTTTDVLRESRVVIGTAANHVLRIFEKHASPLISKDQFLSDPLEGDEGDGAVYAYFDADGRALYVGMTSRKVKAQLRDQTSPHKNAIWWDQWHAMRFLRMTEESDRSVMEMMLIAALNPPFNVKPGGIDATVLFSSMISHQHES